MTPGTKMVHRGRKRRIFTNEFLLEFSATHKNPYKNIQSPIIFHSIRSPKTLNKMPFFKKKPITVQTIPRPFGSSEHNINNPRSDKLFGPVLQLRACSRMCNRFSPSFYSHQKGNHQPRHLGKKKPLKKKDPNKTPWLESNLSQEERNHISLSYFIEAILFSKEKPGAAFFN
jgi:hypothetical protein